MGLVVEANSSSQFCHNAPAIVRIWILSKRKHCQEALLSGRIERYKNRVEFVWKFGRLRHSNFDKEIFYKEMSADFEVC